jgi:hypothetical protein
MRIHSEQPFSYLLLLPSDEIVRQKKEVFSTSALARMRLRADIRRVDAPFSTSALKILECITSVILSFVFVFS